LPPLPVPGHPDGGESARALSLCRQSAAIRSSALAANGVEVVGAVLRVGGARAQQHRILRGIVGHGVDGAARTPAPQLQHRRVPELHTENIHNDELTSVSDPDSLNPDPSVLLNLNPYSDPDQDFVRQNFKNVYKNFWAFFRSKTKTYSYRYVFLNTYIGRSDSLNMKFLLFSFFWAKFWPALIWIWISNQDPVSTAGSSTAKIIYHSCFRYTYMYSIYDIKSSKKDSEKNIVLCQKVTPLPNLTVGRDFEKW
jgi:hypothetical protein